MADLIHQKLACRGHRCAAAARADDRAAGRTARPSVHRAAPRGRRTKPYAWSLTGRLPAGLRLRASGLIAGTPRTIDATGTFTFIVRVKDGNGQVATRKLLLRLRR